MPGRAVDHSGSAKRHWGERVLLHKKCADGQARAARSGVQAAMHRHPRARRSGSHGLISPGLPTFAAAHPLPSPAPSDEGDLKKPARRLQRETLHKTFQLLGAVGARDFASRCTHALCNV